MIRWESPNNFEFSNQGSIAQGSSCLNARIPSIKGKKVASRPPAIIMQRLTTCPPELPRSWLAVSKGTWPRVCCKRLKWCVKPTVTTRRIMNMALRTRLRVPPNPAAIFAGDDSRKLGMLAPIPTAIPERPAHRARLHIR